jgi:thiol:disulfide interchange protein DsbD
MRFGVKTNPPLASLAAPFKKGGDGLVAPFAKGGRLTRSVSRGDFLAAALLFVALSAHADGLLPKKSEPEFLPVDQAFELQPLEYRDGKLHVSWRITKGYYLYRDRFKFTLTQPAAAKLGKPVLPPSESHKDEHFGKTEIFHDAKLVAQLPVSGAAAPPFKLTVVYQGCADKGLCYPPQTRTLEAER